MKSNGELKEQMLEQEKDINDRINRLYGADVGEKKATSSLSDEEKKHIRKQMVLSIWIVVIIGILMIFGVVKPIDFFKEEDKIVSEEKEVLSGLPSGDIDVENDEIQKMINLFKFDTKNPLYEENILKLYNGNELDEMDFGTIMFLLTSNSEFNDYIYKNTKLKDFNPTGTENFNISIPVEKIDSIAEKIFDKEFEIKYENFKFYYDFGLNGIQYFDVILENEIYTFNPIEQLEKSKISAYSKVISATNIDDDIYIRYNLIFVNDNGIYSDSQMKKYLGNDMSKVNSYILEGSIFENVYSRVLDLDNDKIDYYLTNLILVSNGNKEYVYE